VFPKSTKKHEYLNNKNRYSENGKRKTQVFSSHTLGT